MDTIVTFLEENYFYVAGIGLIIIIMLIGLIASSRKAKKAKAMENTSPMANINEVQTGEINQVADQLKPAEVKPVEAAPMSFSSQPVVEPIQEPDAMTKPMASPIEVKPFPEATIKNDEDKFAKTEVIDFSGLNSKPAEPTASPFASDTSQYNDNLLNGEETKSTPIDINKPF